MSKMRFFALQELANRQPLEVTTPSNKLSDYYGSHVFDRKKMQEYLPREAYKAVTDAIEKGTPINREMADLIANGMKSWAKSLNVTHYTHWFQPLTDGTAEKHDGFIEFGEGTEVIERFSGKLLIQQEPDASSFPNGGIRNTFEARGYTAWDVSSPAFVVDTTLCIPTIFISYTGEALDYKTPLLKALAAVDKAATDVCQLFDKNITRVYTNLGWEQEYFLVDSALYNARPDLCLTGRTLMGHSSAKDQQLEDHYFGSIPPRVTAFMKELEIECHKLGIPVKTRHNEVAPNQFELAPIFENANLANDHNQLVMDLMKRIARKHHFAVLLHEKPYNGVNGSGKHNNWSISTDTGKNLLEPGKLPQENAQFLLFLAAVIKGVDEYQDLLRISVASAGNDHRLGANEAPPAIISIFLGDELTAILHAIETGTVYGGTLRVNMEIGVNVLPSFTKDTTDRNRTSPFAFTGNKFEFRSLGSQLNIACPNIMLNTIIADELEQFADELEGKEDFNGALNALIKRVIKEHKRIIFNGDGYADAWKAEAAKRGLTNLPTTVDALPHYTDEKNVKLFTKHKIYTEVEMQSRQDIILETYAKTINIEALTASDMVKRDILPAVSSYVAELASGVATKKAISDDIPCEAELDIIKRLSGLQDCAYKKLAALDNAIIGVKEVGEDPIEVATYYKDSVITAMTELRAVVDEMETLVSSDYWPYPSYGDLMFRV